MRGSVKLFATVISISAFGPALQAEGSAYSQVRSVDAQFREAMVKGDTPTLDRIVAPDAKIIHGNNGAIKNKKDLLSEYRAWHINRYERTPVMSQVNGNLAVLISETRKTSGARVRNTATTEVFVRRAGEWKLYSLQNTDHPDA